MSKSDVYAVVIMACMFLAMMLYAVGMFCTATALCVIGITCVVMAYCDCAQGRHKKKRKRR